jgi:mono/diheme cytochrome c family protein
MKIEPRIKLILFIAVIFLLVANGLILYRNYSSEWRQYQREYLDKAFEMASDQRVKDIIAAREPRIEQLVICKFGDERVERCITCHTSIDDKRFADAPQPFKSHPAILEKHNYREYGCTPCHDGNGRGLTAYDAHGQDHYWMRPLLKGDFAESTCAKCHPSPYLEETPYLRKGAKLFMTKACYGCHKVEGISEGKLGVELSEAGAKWRIEYLKESIVDPKANNPESLMPHLGLSEEEVKALVIYLKSLTGEDLVDGPVRNYMSLKAWENKGKAKVEISLESGQTLFASKGCIACHRVNGVGELVGPDLSVVGLQRTKEWIIQHFINPRSLVAGSLMPDFELSQSEMDALTLYLMSLKGTLKDEN